MLGHPVASAEHRSEARESRRPPTSASSPAPSKSLHSHSSASTSNRLHIGQRPTSRPTSTRTQHQHQHQRPETAAGVPGPQAAGHWFTTTERQALSPVSWLCFARSLLTARTATPSPGIRGFGGRAGGERRWRGGEEVDSESGNFATCASMG